MYLFNILLLLFSKRESIHQNINSKSQSLNIGDNFHCIYLIFYYYSQKDMLCFSIKKSLVFKVIELKLFCGTPHVITRKCSRSMQYLPFQLVTRWNHSVAISSKSSVLQRSVLHVFHSSDTCCNPGLPHC